MPASVKLKIHMTYPLAVAVIKQIDEHDTIVGHDSRIYLHLAMLLFGEVALFSTL